MVNSTEICCTAISIGILMTLSSSVALTTREKLSFETVYADRVGKAYGDRVDKVYNRIAPGQNEALDPWPIYCDARGDCIRRCGGATCAVDVFRGEPRTAQPAQGRPETPRPSPR